MTRREFTRAQKAAIIKRAMDGKGRIRCDLCGIDCTGKRVEVDHIIAESLRPAEDLAKPLTIAEGQALCGACHDAKTFRADIPNAAKAKRREAIHIGAKAPPRKKIQSRGFPKSERRKPATAPLTKALPPRRFVDE